MNLNFRIVGYFTICGIIGHLLIQILGLIDFESPLYIQVYRVIAVLTPAWLLALGQDNSLFLSTLIIIFNLVLWFLIGLLLGFNGNMPQKIVFRFVGIILPVLFAYWVLGSSVFAALSVLVFLMTIFIIAHIDANKMPNKSSM